ncbi:MAG: hypothetical protein LBM02_06580 [Lachnospiraceae bacterium]|jgi:hypothetical protein|nr:hypothetical protein [Lachnospiraceae bacterium]
MNNYKAYIVFVITTIYCSIFVYSQTSDSIYPKDYYLPMKPLIPLDTNIIYTDMSDYALQVKITEICTTYSINTNTIYLDKYNAIYAITPAYFLKMKVIRKIHDFSLDSIPDSIITNIKYLMVPSYLVDRKKIPFDTLINIMVNRGINYDYLKFNYIFDNNAKFEKRDPYFAGTVGLESKGDPPKILWKLFRCKIISYNTLLKLTPKSKNSKNIERSLKILKKQDNSN